MKVRLYMTGYADPVDVTVTGGLEVIERYAKQREGEIVAFSAICRGCGCTDDEACPEGCWWVEPDLCSSCRATPA